MEQKFVSAKEAVSLIKSNQRVFIHSVAGTPQQLIEAMVERSDELRNVEVVHIHTEGYAPYVEEQYEGIFQANVFFIGANTRKAVNEGRASYLPVFLSEVPLLFRKKILPLDVAMVTLSPPDKHGYCSLGVSVDSSLAAVQSAKTVIAQINPNMPRSHGDGMVHVSEIDAMIEVNDPLISVTPKPFTDVEQKIGGYVASLIEDGSTLQMGIGSIPDAVLASLTNHKDLGIHTEMFSDGVVDLYKKGVITGRYKKVMPGKIVAGFAMGTQELYDFVDDNPLVAMKEVTFTNDTAIIRRNPKVIAINSAIEVDVTGQVCADSIGNRLYSGVGGQMDFIRGASLSEGGKPIIALPSTTRRGETRIVPNLKEGAGVVTTRAHVHYVVTEYGIANLYGKNLKQRAKELIRISHPDHREDLERSLHNRLKKF
jgi:acyl-CoA hydrolase